MADVCHHTRCILQRAQKVSHDWSSPASDLDWCQTPSGYHTPCDLFCCWGVTLATSETLLIFGLEPSSPGFADVHTVIITISTEGWPLSGLSMIITMNKALFNWSWTHNWSGQILTAIAQDTGIHHFHSDSCALSNVFLEV